MHGITRTISDVINMTWPMVLVSVVIVASIRICYLIKNRQHFTLYKELLTLSMIIYVLMLFQVVTSQDVVSWSSNNFIPFKEMLRYKFGSRLFIKNVVGNLALFLPYGFFAAYTLKCEKGKLILFLTILASLTIECVQMAIGRVFDVDDIILNVLGGLIGYLIYLLIDRIYNMLPKFFKTKFFLNIFAIILFVCAIVGILFIMI